MSSLFGIGGGGNVGAAGGFYSYSIDQSLRFEESRTANLTRTPSSAATDNKKFTFSVWIKRGQDSADNQHIVQSKNTGSGTGQGHVGLYIDTSDKINFYSENGSANGSGTRLLRDHSAWYHICFVYNTTEATAADRIKIYINGEQETLTGSFPALNSVMSSMNYNGQQQYIGKYVSGFTRYFNGYMAEMHMVDGTALDPTSFGETINGIWVPKEYSGSYGTNGWYLSFADSSAIGDDLSGNTNDWTANNLAASDVVPDSPTNSFCTLNPLTHGTYPTLSEGNLKIASVYSADLCGVTSTWYPTTGKWYWEVHLEGNTATYPIVGITDQRYTMTNATTGSYYSLAWRRGTGVDIGSASYMGTKTVRNADSTTNNDINMFALDVDARKIWIGKNGTWNSDGDPATGANPDGSWTLDTGVSPSFMGYNGQGVATVFNFGQDGTFAGNQTAQGNADDNGVGNFYYSPPSGFLAMATSNIDDGNIGPNSTTTSDQNFNTVVYTGNGTAIASGGISVTGVNFQPDFVWIKSRTNAYDNMLFDNVRGTLKIIKSNSTAAEITSNTENLNSFDADGFTYGSELSGNASGASHVSWNWKAGGTAVSNTDGSITSSVSANPDAGFSIVSFTCGSGVTSGTVGHGLGVQPQLIIGKTRNHAVGWYIHTPLLAANLTGAFDTAAWYDPGYNHWNDTHPTDTVFSVGGYMAGHADLTSPSTKICYCFANVEGHQKVGLYVGNGNADGTFVYTGFRPAFVLLKKTSAAGDNWSMYDNKRDTDNTVREYIIPNQSAAAASTDTMDFVSNGFKVRNSGAYINTSGATYIYLAFADGQPFKYANAR